MSSQIVGILPGVSNNDFHRNKYEPCDVFFKAKQTHSSFPISYNKADDLFELIHYDVMYGVHIVFSLHIVPLIS